MMQVIASHRPMHGYAYFYIVGLPYPCTVGPLMAAAAINGQRVLIFGIWAPDAGKHLSDITISGLMVLAADDHNVSAHSSL